MLQKVTFVAHMTVDIPEGMTVVGAKRNVKHALAEAENGKDYALRFVRLIELKALEESE